MRRHSLRQQKRSKHLRSAETISFIRRTVISVVRQTAFIRKEKQMSTIHFHQTTTLTPEQYVAGLTDFGPDRSKLFANSADEYLKVHQRDRTQAAVTEGSGGAWERLHYDWPDPRHVLISTPA